MPRASAHVCTIYDDPIQQLTAVAPLVGQGLARGERVVLISGDVSAEAIETALRASGVEAERERGRGALVLQEGTPPANARFEAEIMLTLMREHARRAAAEGYAGLRFIVEMAGMVGPGTDPVQHLAFESLAGAEDPASPSLILCQYRRARFSPSNLRVALRTHPLVLLGGEVRANSYCEPPKILVDTDAEAAHVDWMLQQLDQARAAEAARARTEAALRASEERYRRLAEHAQDVIFRYEYTPRRGFTYVSPAAARVVGYSPEEHYADPDLGRKFIHPEDLAVLETVLERGAVTGSVEQRWWHKDGRLVWIEQRNVPIYDADGSLVAVEGIARDITERKRAEQMQRFLADASARLAHSLDYQATLQQIARLAVPALADWCVVDTLDQDGSIRLLAVSHVEPAKEALVHELRRRYPPDPNRPYGLPKVLRTGQPELYSAIDQDWRRQAARDPEHLRLMDELGARSSLCVPLVARGQLLGALTFVYAESGRQYEQADLELAQDLATRCALALDNARLFKQAQEALQLREAFMGLLAHDLASPLTAVRGYVQLLQRRAERTARPELVEFTALLAPIATNVEKMAGLLGDLLDMARIEAGQPPALHLAPTDLVALARAVVSAQQAQTEKHRAWVETREVALVGLWDRARLERVVDNLVSNAIKYSPQGGEIAVEVAREGEQAVLRVRDQGLGIPASDLPRIFERFHRAGNVEGRMQGTGLGLWGSRQFVELHGGAIQVESQEGLGTTVTIRLPLQGPPQGPSDNGASAG